ncbi:hypothetical protein A0130_11105 [Leifsonia xyli]|uniref:YcaO-like family protein n=1 Tax=Leifsonia xyli TaxID=1575 RepID=UPI0007CDADF9|nr:hypothetical protein A0130_11105 [Leifsonia xyli]
MESILEAIGRHLPMPPLRSHHQTEPSITFTHPRDSRIFAVGNAHGACAKCFERKVDILWSRVDGHDRTLSASESVDAVEEAARHGVALAITNASIGQNWSVIAPWPDCAECRRTGAARRQLLPEAQAGPTAGECHGDSCSGIPRSASPETFVAAHRGWFGFASVLLNPALVHEQGICTADSAIFLDEAETFAPVGGKGATREQALASCLGEGIERFAVAGGFDEPDAPIVAIPAAGISRAAWGDARDFDGEPVPIGSRDLVDHVMLASLTGARPRPFPASLVYAPYTPAAGRRSSTPSSTTGAAVGASLVEATLQAVLELIERDAFWFYARTGRTISALDVDDHPLSLELARSTGARLRAGVLANPFNVPVVHVTLARPAGAGGSATARGMGAATTLGAALRKAVIEAAQMMRSLDTGREVGPSITDMRSLWFSGAARPMFSSFFEPDPVHSVSWRSDSQRISGEGDPAQSLAEVLRRASGAGVEFYRHTFVDAATFAAVRVIGDRILPLDDLYFPRLERFRDWADGNDERATAYTGPLFM